MILTVQNSRIFHEFVQGLRFYKKKKSVLFVVYLVEFEEIVKFIENGFGLVWSTVLKSSDTSGIGWPDIALLIWFGLKTYC